MLCFINLICIHYLIRFTSFSPGEFCWRWRAFCYNLKWVWGFPHSSNRWWRICLQCRRPGFYPWVRKIPWRRKGQPTLVFLPREFHGQKSLTGYSSWDHKESDMIEQLTLTQVSLGAKRRDLICLNIPFKN